MSRSHDPGDATHGTTLAKGAALNALALMASNLRGIFTLLIARLMGEAALGSFGVAWAVMDLASKFGTLGLDYRVTALVAASESAGDRPQSRLLLSQSLKVSVSAALVVAVLGASLAAASTRLTTVPRDLAWATAVLFLAIPGLVLYRVSNAVSRGMKVMQHDIVSRLTDNLVSAAVLVTLVVLGAGTLAPELAAIAGTLLSGVVAWRLARRLFEPRPVKSNFGRSIGLLRTSAPVAVYDFLNIGVMRLDVILLGLFIGRVPDVTLQSVGIYAASVEVAGGLRKVSQAFTPIFTPVLAEHLAAGRRRDAEESYAYVARWMLAILLPAVAVLALSGGSILTVFGPSFHRGAPWVAVVGVACALNAFVGLGETILMVTRPGWNVVNTSVACVAGVGLNLWLIPRYGPLGAALGMLVPYAIQGALRGLEISRLLGWRWSWRPLGRPWVAALSALPVGLLVRYMTSGIASEIGAGAAYLLAYACAWYVLGLEPADRAILDRLRPDRRPAATGRD